MVTVNREGHYRLVDTPVLTERARLANLPDVVMPVGGYGHDLLAIGLEDRCLVGWVVTAGHHAARPRRPPRRLHPRPATVGNVVHARDLH